MPNAPIRSISIIIPLYNEEPVLVPLLKRMLPVLWKLRRRWQVELCLVDDGSEDRTLEHLREHFTGLPGVDTRILHHTENQGLGAGMATGFDAVEGDVVCTIDADCTYAPEMIENLVDRLERDGADIVTASPYHPLAARETGGGGRLVLSRTASRLYALLAPARLHCYTSFFRVYRREWARPDLFGSNDFLAVTEILIAAAQEGAHIVEQPVRLGLRAYGRSKMKLARTTWSHFRLMTRTAIGLRPGGNRRAKANPSKEAKRSNSLKGWKLARQSNRRR